MEGEEGVRYESAEEEGWMAEERGMREGGAVGMGRGRERELEDGWRMEG